MENWHELQIEIEARVTELNGRRSGLGCRVVATAGQTIANRTPTALAFDSEILGNAEIWSEREPTRLYAPADGYYNAAGSWTLAQAQNAVASRMWCGIRVNGTVYVAGSEIHTLAGRHANHAVNALYFWLNAGDYVEIMAYHEQGAAKTTYPASATEQHSCHAALLRIGG